MDITNAFNSVSRYSLLQGALRKVPGAYNWLAWCYASPCPLFCQGQLLTQSSVGVHQGDAMGPLAFALGLDSILDQCAIPQSALAWSSWYLDDRVIVGTLPAVRNYLQAIHNAAASAGLTLNLSKCSLWGPGADGLVGAGPPFPQTRCLIAPFAQYPYLASPLGRVLRSWGHPLTPSLP